MNQVRLVDVFLFGPVQILVGLKVKNIVLKAFLILTGLLNILYNGHNYLYFDHKIHKFYLFNPFIDDRNGKLQIHRVYNLLVMYPVFMYVYATTELPKWLATLFLLDIIVGFSFNLYNYVSLFHL